MRSNMRVMIQWALLLLFVVAIWLPQENSLYAQQDRVDPIVRPDELKSEEQITRFILRVLTDTEERNDPFVRKQAVIRQTATYDVEEKPRPQSGFGKYDVETLRLMAIWKEGKDDVAVVRCPDGKAFTVKVGDEAYDGRLVEINMQAGFIKFLQELKRSSGPVIPGEPEIKYVEKVVRFNR